MKILNIHKHKQIILYVIFGVLTTGVNYIIYFIFTRWLSMSIVVSNTVAWILAVLFAYITNRYCVFESTTKRFLHILQELWKFIAARIFSGLLDTVVILFLVNFLSINDMVAKILVGILVVVTNYVLSKSIVFKSKT